MRVFRRSFTVALLVALAALGCRTGDPVLKARAAAADSVVLAGETFLLVGGVFNSLCPAKRLSVETCASFRVFAEEFKVKYPAIAREYQSQKEVATSTAQGLSALVAQLTGFTKAAAAAGGSK